MSSMQTRTLFIACMVWMAHAADAKAAIIDIVATTDGQVFVANGVPTASFSTNGSTNLTQNVIANQEERSVYEFDLPTLTESIVSATFLGSVVLNSAPPAVLSFFGYSGNGTVEASDAAQLATLIGSTTLTTQIPTGTSLPISVPLTASFIEALGSGFLGLTTTVGSGDSVLVASLESTVGLRPTLRIETASLPPGPGPVPVPEPSTMLLIGSGLATLVRRRRTP
jgi:PEP-CTERM motif